MWHGQEKGKKKVFSSKIVGDFGLFKHDLSVLPARPSNKPFCASNSYILACLASLSIKLGFISKDQMQEEGLGHST